MNCHAVKNNRQTMQGGISKTDKKDASSILDLLQQGKFFLPVERDPELAAAYRLMRRHMGVKKRVGQIRNQLRGALHLSFPELSNVIKDITQPTALRFLQSNPTPEFIMINGRKRFLEKLRPRRKCGQWRPEKLNLIYDLAQKSVGLRDPHRSDAFEIRTLIWLTFSRENMPFLIFFVFITKITLFLSLHNQRRDHHVSTVDHSDILGLVTV